MCVLGLHRPDTELPDIRPIFFVGYRISGRISGWIVTTWFFFYKPYYQQNFLTFLIAISLLYSTNSRLLGQSLVYVLFQFICLLFLIQNSFSGRISGYLASRISIRLSKKAGYPAGRISGATLSQTETFRIVKGVDLRAVYKISSQSDTYGQFYRPIKAENGNKNTYYIFLLSFSAFIVLLNRTGVRSGWNFLNSPQIQPFDDPENFSLIGPVRLTVHFQSGNKNT